MISVREWVELAPQDNVPNTIPINGLDNILIRWQGSLYWVPQSAVKQANPDGTTDCDDCDVAICGAPVPTPTSVPLPTATPIPAVCPAGVGRYSPGRFDDKNWLNVFGAGNIAVVGIYGFHDGLNPGEFGSTLDIMPAQLEACVDSQQCSASEDMQIPVYASVAITVAPEIHAGNGNNLILLLEDDVISWQGGPCGLGANGRREIYLEHIQVAPGVRRYAEWNPLSAGTQLGTVEISRSDLPSKTVVHLAFQLRFYNQNMRPYTTRACAEEVLGVLVDSNVQVVDQYMNIAPITQWPEGTLPWPSSMRVLACPME